MKDKVVIITGASSGIGKACALEFAKHCGGIVITGRNETNLIAVAAEIKKINANVLTVVADVAVESDCKKIIDETIKKFNRIDALINNAGISMRALVEDVDVTVLQKVMATNFWGMVYCTKYALPHLLKTKGSVIGVSSTACRQSFFSGCG